MDADALFNAFADPTRRRVVRLLNGRTLCVCDIVDALRLPQPKVSRHLGTLQDAGLVRSKKRGRWRHYGLTDARGIAAALTACASAERDSSGDLLRLKKLARRTCA